MAQPSQITLLEEMLRIRRVEERIASEYKGQMMRCPVHLSIGQEATPVGICSVLTRNDYAMSTHRSHAHYIAKGGDLKSMIAEIYGKDAGCSRGKGGSMHLVDHRCGFLGATPIVGSTIPIAVGTALSSKMQKSPNITTVFFGEGATEEGAFFEALNFAALKKLSVLFVCENNLYSVYSPLSVRQPEARNLVTLAEGHGMWAAAGDGNKIEEVVRLAGEGVRRIRAGEGPVLLEFSTYRWLEHCGPNYDNDIGYRTPAEYESWRKLCPIESMLQEKISKDELKSVEVKIAAEIDAAFTFAKEAPFPPPSELTTSVYREKQS